MPQTASEEEAPGSWVTVRTFGGFDASMQAEMARLELEAHDVEVLILDSHTANVDPLLGTAATVRLQVREPDADHARALLVARSREDYAQVPARRVGSARPLLGALAGVLFTATLLSLANGRLSFWAAWAMCLLLVFGGWHAGRWFDRFRCSKCRQAVDRAAPECGHCRAPFG